MFDESYMGERVFVLFCLWFPFHKIKNDSIISNNNFRERESLTVETAPLEKNDSGERQRTTVRSVNM